MATNQNKVEEVLDRAVGVGGKGVQNLGAYKDKNGNTTTVRPEFAGQTVQLGKQYVTYDSNGSPTSATSVKHAQKLGNDYTKQNMGLDQTKVSNAADIYRGVYNATMNNPATVSGTSLDNAYGKRNIQHSGALGVGDYDKLIRNAAAKGSNVLAGYYEDSRNALLQSTGKSGMQSSTYNGGWNYVDNGGGVGNIYAGARKDPLQTNQAFGGGWYAGQGKGAAAEEYRYLNTDAPSMREILDFAAAKGYNTADETATIPVGNLAREMMAGGYVSPATRQKADALKNSVPAALRNLGVASSNSGTDALDTAVRNMQRAGTVNSYTQAAQSVGQQNGGFSAAYGGVYGGYGGASGAVSTYGGSPENQLMNLYGSGGGYTEALQRLRGLTDLQVLQATRGYDAQKNGVNLSYADMFRQLYIDRENAKKNMGQQLAAYGITGGAAESTMLGLDTTYQNALREGEQSRIGAIADLDQAILQAQLTGEISYAQQALQMEQKRLDNYADVLQTMMNRQDKQQQTAYDRQMEHAELLASIGDFSGYKALGYSDAEIAALEKAYAAEHAAKNSSSGSSKAKPALTLSQAEKLLEAGVVTEKTLSAYKWYTGQDWQSGRLQPVNKPIFSNLIDLLKGGTNKEIEQYVDSVWGTLTEVQQEEMVKLLHHYGYNY